LLSPYYQFDRPQPVPVNEKALTAKLTAGFERLAIPRYTQEQEMNRFNRNFIEETKLPFIPEEAKFYMPISKRLLAISVPRLDPLDADDFLLRQDPFAVKSGALKASISKRLTELSNPRSKLDMQEIYNAYKVSQKALRAKCTPRLKELCLPVESKRRTKPPEKKKSKKRPFRL
jgi:hypothetical protein